MKSQLHVMGCEVLCNVNFLWSQAKICCKQTPSISRHSFVHLYPIIPWSRVLVIITVYVAHGETMNQFKLDIHNLMEVCQC